MFQKSTTKNDALLLSEVPETKALKIWLNTVVFTSSTFFIVVDITFYDAPGHSDYHYSDLWKYLKFTSYIQVLPDEISVIVNKGLSCLSMCQDIQPCFIVTQKTINE